MALTAVLLLPRLAFPLGERWLDAPRGAQFHLTLWRALLAGFMIMGMRGWGSVLYRVLHGMKEDMGKDAKAGNSTETAPTPPITAPAPTPWSGVPIALGAMALALWIFFCGVIGMYNIAGAVLTFALLLAGFLFNFSSSITLGSPISRLAWFSRPQSPSAAPALSITLPALIAFAVLALSAFLRGVEAFAPPYAWDALTYHLAVPRQWLAAGGITPIPLNIYSNMPMNLNLIYLAAMWLGDPIAAQVMHFALGLLAAQGLILAGRRLGSAVAGCAAALMFIGAPSVYYQWGVAFVDVGMAFAAVAMVHLLFDAMDRPRRARGAMLAAGVVAAFIMGCKYTGVYVPAALLLAAAVAGPSSFRRELMRPKNCIAAGGLALALVVPWLAKSALLTGNPLYPLFFDIFGGRWWSPRQAAWIIEWQRGIGMGRGALDYLHLPWRVAAAAGGDYGHFAGRLLALPFALSALVPLFWGHARLRVVWLAFWLGFAMWALGSQQIRFLIPLYPLLCLSSGMALAHLAQALGKLFGGAEKLRPKINFSWRKDGPAWRGERRPDRWQGAAAALLLPVALLALRAADRPVAGELDPKAGWAFVSQQVSAREFLRPRVRSFEAYEWLEGEAREGRAALDARVVMLFENMGLYCPLPWTADGMFEASWLADLALEAGGPDGFAERVRAEFSPAFILVNGNILRDIEAGRAAGAGEGQYRTFRDGELHDAYFRALDIQKEFLERHCEPVFTSAMNTTVYRMSKGEIKEPTRDELPE